MVNANGILNHYIEAKKIIAEARKDGQLVIFVGAGASISSGMPTWSQAIRAIASHLRIDDRELNFLRIPQYYFNARGKKEYTQLMRKIFRYGDFLQKHEIHDRIIEFNTHTIITTNYDSLIEKAAEDNSEVICVVSKDADLPYRKGGKELLKIHGDFENDNFVLKEDDYLSYSRNFRLIENYVKSLIGTKVVLFVGYSFNDPDIKQIFSWSKDILHGDFQRAYLIESGKEYDSNEADYYENFGINVLYASLQLNENFKENDLTLNLLNMLNWLLEEEKPAKLDELYDDLKLFKSMGFAGDRYLETAFRKAGLRIEMGVLSEFTSIREHKESSKIFRSLAYEQCIRLSLAESNKIDNEDNEESKNNIEKKERIHKFLKDWEPEEYDQEKIKIIIDILEKSSVCCLELYTPSENNFGRHRDFLELMNHDIPNWVEAVNTFDYRALKNIVDKNIPYLAESRPQLYAEQGYLYYILKEYFSAYNCFKMATSIYYRQREYIKYFIAETNRYLIGRIVIDSNGTISGVGQSDAKIVKEEINAIDLDRTYRSLPNMGGNNKVLKDIYTFNIAHALFQDAYSTSEKVKEQADSNYTFFSGISAFSSMRRSMEDYYNYIVLNQLAVDRYTEHIKIFRIYFQSIIGSVTAANMGNHDPFHKDKVGNVHADKLNRFDLMVALKYEEFKKLQRLLKNISINLPMEEDAMDYLMVVISRYEKWPVKSIFLADNFFWKAILILGYCELNEKLVEITLNKINECINILDYREYGNVIIRFLKNAETHGLINNFNVELIELFLKTEMKYLCNDKTESIMHISLVLQSAWLCQKYMHTYDDKETISQLLSDEGRMLCVKIYPYVGNACKNIICETYKDWKLKRGNQDFDFYCSLVELGILVPDKNAEQEIFSYYKEQRKEAEIDKETMFILPTQSDNELIFHLVELYLKDCIIDTESLIKIAKERDIESALWLMDYENFDYDLFDINWVKLCSSRLLKEMSSSFSVKQNISKKFVDAYNMGKIDRDLLDVYFHYFAGVLDESNKDA